MESSGRAVSKTVPGFEFRATFEGDIEGFIPLQVLVATTVLVSNLNKEATMLLQKKSIPFPFSGVSFMID